MTTAARAKQWSFGDFADLYRAAPVDRIGLIKRGFPAREAKSMLAHLSLPAGDGMRALRLSAATVNRKSARQEVLAPEDSERVLGLAKLIGQVQVMVDESGDPEGFDAESWLSAWLRTPVPALGGTRPIDLIDTMEGQALVSQVLTRMQSGAYA